VALFIIVKTRNDSNVHQVKNKENKIYMYTAKYCYWKLIKHWHILKHRCTSKCVVKETVSIIYDSFAWTVKIDQCRGTEAD
jgi:hypothetical protein